MIERVCTGEIPCSALIRTGRFLKTDSPAARDTTLSPTPTPPRRRSDTAQIRPRGRLKRDAREIPRERCIAGLSMSESMAGDRLSFDQSSKALQCITGNTGRLRFARESMRERIYLNLRKFSCLRRSLVFSLARVGRLGAANDLVPGVLFARKI